MKNIVIIGPPGSGKDTQIDEMSKFLDFAQVSTGDIVRKLSAKNDKIKQIMEQGGLVDDSVILTAIDNELSKIDKEQGIVFDGFPRTLHQAEMLNEILLHHNRVLDMVIYISLEEDVIVSRLSKRMVCSACGHNVQQGAAKCGDCGGKPIRRGDDEPAVIINRVQAYLENTLPLVTYYRNKNILLEIDGDKTVAKVAADIKEGFGEGSR